MTIPTRRCAATSSSINAEIFRGRYLSGYDHPTALTPGSIHEYKFSLHDVDHVFKAGHTVMVEIQSTWFPLYDRNPQTFVPNIMKAKPARLQARDHHHLLRPRPRLRARIARHGARPERRPSLRGSKRRASRYSFSRNCRLRYSSMYTVIGSGIKSRYRPILK